MNKQTTKKLALSGLFLAIGLLLPFLTAQNQALGTKLLPMHIPVLLCGFICGWQYGLIVGFIAPILRSLLFTMPPMFPIAVAMSFELAAYGILTGLLYRLFPKKNAYIFITLILSMLGGRVIWGAVSYILFGMAGNAFTWKMFMGGAVLNVIPGMIIQLVLIPILLIALKRANLIENE